MTPRLTWIALLATALACLLGAGPAHATHVACGDTITADTTLDSDLQNCSADGLVIGADGVTLDLGGHTIGSGADAGTGVLVDFRTDTEIRNGTIRGFRKGVAGDEPDGVTLRRVRLLDNVTGMDLFVAFGVTKVVDTTVSGGRRGLSLDGRTQIARTTVSNVAGKGIALDSAGGTVEDSTIRGNEVGIDLFEADSTIRRNRIVGNRAAGVSYHSQQDGVLANNLIARNGVGVTLYISNILVQRNVLRRNEGAGLETGPYATVANNQVVRNGGNGIVANCTPVLGNRVHHNGASGIVSNCGPPDETDPAQPIEENDVRWNGGDGILVRRNSGPVQVTANRTEGNGDDGIDVDGQHFSVVESVWSPDRSLIATRMAHSDPALNGLYLLAADGSIVRRLAESGAAPAWSPLGDRIAYRDGGIVTIGVDGSDAVTLTNGIGFGHKWSPTAEKILFEDSGFIHVVDAAGGASLQLARGSDPEWSPDGTRIVYQIANEIHIVNADGSGDVLVIEGGHPTWSPDGNRIAFTDGTDLATVATDGTDLHYLTVDDPADYAPDWSPDGSRIAFLRAAGADVATYFVNAEGGPLFRVSDSDAPPEWPLDRPRLESDGTIVAPNGTVVATLEIDHNILVTLARNRANRNADLGIEAAEGVIDGGGNGAAGNGDPLQCASVVCG